MKYPSEAEMEIHGANVTLRPVHGADAAALAPVLNYPSLHTYTGGEPRSFDRLRDWFTALESRTSPDGAELWLTWVVLSDSRPCGYVQATVAADHAYLAWVTGSSFQNRGIATAAVGLMIDWAGSFLGVQMFRAAIAPGNAPSQRVAQKNGFRPTENTADGEVVWLRD